MAVHVPYNELQKLLIHHYQERDANLTWLNSCLEGQAGIAFPYMRGDVVQISNVITASVPSHLPSLNDSTLPVYVINIPVGISPTMDISERIHHLLQLFEEQSFGTNVVTSKSEAEKRTAIVFGVNQVMSINVHCNLVFQAAIDYLTTFSSLPYRVVAFQWAPTWVIKTSVPNLYSLDIAFRLFRLHDPLKAEAFRLAFEGGNQLREIIPYKRIRETLKNCDATALFVNTFAKKSPFSPLYYGVMDADPVAFKNTNQEGLFSRYDTLIQRHQVIPSAVTLGYTFYDPQYPLIRLASEIDMIVRQAMSAAICFGAYFPEPGTFFKVKDPGALSRLHEISFLGGNGATLENRRLIQNGVAAGIFTNGVFSYDGGIYTSTPSRAYTLKLKRLTYEPTSSEIKQKQTLETLFGGLVQSHASAREWGESIYTALGFNVPSLNFHASNALTASSQIGMMFKVFNPYSRMISGGALEGRFSKKIFDNVMKTYHLPLSQALIQLLEETKHTLRGLGMPPNLISMVENAARLSGQAIHRYLSRYM
jgi:hypothetical protein